MTDKKLEKELKQKTVVAMALLLAPGIADAAGFALIEQSVSGLGAAFAGGAVQRDDASALFFNPAAMAELKGRQLSTALHLVLPSFEFQAGAAANRVFPAAGAIAGGLGGDAGSPGAIPNFYYVADMSPAMKWGMGINAPFGLKTGYDDGWIGRYHALESELRTINVNPAVALRANERLSLGFGVDVQYVEAKLSAAVDGGSLLGLGVGTADFTSRVEGEDVSVGYNFGLLWRVTDNTRVGIAYRSAITHTLKGDATFSSVPGPLVPVGFSNTTITAKATLPETLSLSLAHELASGVELMADVTHTEWSRFKELRVDFANALPDAVTTHDWRDSQRYSLGLAYRTNDRLILRSGVAYDETPVPSAARRSPRIPDNNRTWVTLGASWKATPDITLDAAYAHLFVPDTPIDNTTESASLRHRLTGTYESSVDIFSVQLNWRL